MSLDAIPDHLRIKGRSTDNSFTRDELLYRWFSEEDLDDISGSIKPEHLRSPDYSCNWSKFSFPNDVKHKKDHYSNDGCYSIKIEDAKYKKFATPVHDPIEEEDYENFSHVDVRRLKPSEPENFIPPPDRKLSKSRASKLEYRQHVINNLNIEFYPD